VSVLGNRVVREDRGLAPSVYDIPKVECATKSVVANTTLVLGAKAVGESGTLGSAPVVQSAVSDALSGCGVRHLDMPLLPEGVWRAIAGA
jgi:aerobic carbon-monoxide dehydrogenase large subunit